MGSALVKGALQKAGLYRLDQRLKRRFRIAKKGMSYPPWDADTEMEIRSSIDTVRYAAIALAVGRLNTDGIDGPFAEAGVYQGNVGRFLRHLAPDRRIHLFDTFEGFPEEEGEESDGRFTDTSVDAVRRHIGGDPQLLHFHPGVVPDTMDELGDETISFLSMDLDRYAGTSAALRAFFPRLAVGGFVFVHDYNSPESNRGVSRAVDEWIAGRAEQLIEIPDACGSVVIRRVG